MTSTTAATTPTMANITLATTDPAAATDSFNLLEDSFAAFLRSKRNPRTTTTAGTAPPALSPRLHGVYGLSPRLPSALPPSASPRLVEPVTPDRQPVPFYSADDAELSPPTALRQKEERNRRVEWVRSLAPIQSQNNQQQNTIGVVDEAEADDLFSRVPHKFQRPPPQIMSLPDPTQIISSPTNDIKKTEAMSLQLPFENVGITSIRRNSNNTSSFLPWAPSPVHDNDKKLKSSQQHQQSSVTSSMAALFNDISPASRRRHDQQQDLLTVSSAASSIPTAPTLAIPPIVNFPVPNNSNLNITGMTSAPTVAPAPPSALGLHTKNTSPILTGTAPPNLGESFRNTKDIFAIANPTTTTNIPMSSAHMNTNPTSMFTMTNGNTITSPAPTPMDITVGAGPITNLNMNNGTVMTPRSAAISALLGSNSSSMSDGDFGVRKRPPRREIDRMTDISPSNKLSLTTKNYTISKANLSTSNHPRKSSSLPLTTVRKADGTVDPLQCNICKQRFARRSNLFKHLRSVHEELRKFACTACSFKFKRQDHLLKHTRSVHAKVRKFSCDICGIGFAEKFNRDKHCRSIHQTKRAFRCPCGAYFQDRTKMSNCLRCKRQQQSQQVQPLQQNLLNAQTTVQPSGQLNRQTTY